MGDGWIKVHRELISHPIWKNSSPQHKTVLITLLCMANHEANQWEWNGRQFVVKPGQFVTSIEHIRQSCGKGVSTQNVRSALARFKKLEFLTYESTKTGTLVTIEKWGKWQGSDATGNKDTNKEVTNNQQTGNKQVTTNKNDKNDKKDKEDIYSDVPEEIKDAFMDWIQMRKDKKKPIRTKRAVTMALNKLNALSKNPEKQRELIDYAIYRNWESFYPIPDGDKIPKPRVEAEQPEQEIDAVPMPDETRDKLNALGMGNVIGKG